MKLEQNQTLWFVGAENRAGLMGRVTVGKVGRKWADITGTHRGRIAVDTLIADGGAYGAPGRCYASKEAWLEKEGPQLAWRAFCNRLPVNCPSGLSYQEIVRIGKLLGLDLVTVVEGKPAGMGELYETAEDE